MTFDQYCRNVGYDRTKCAPDIRYSWASMKNGEVQIHPTEVEARKRSKLVERIADPISKEIYDQFWEEQRAGEKRAFVAWYDGLIDEFRGLDHRVFDLCYAEAYERGHSEGYDEVYQCMQNIVEFVEKVLEVLENT